MSFDLFLERIHRQRVLPVLRLGSADEALAAAQSLLRQRLRVIELTATTPDWMNVLRKLQTAVPDDALVGLGSVVDEATARAAVDAGASFLVSPWPSPTVRAVARDAGMPFLEGAFSPGEFAAAAARGPVKLFPAHVGGPQMLRSLLALLPDAVVVPTGGIGLHDVTAWLSAGAHAVGVGSGLLRPGAAEVLRALLEDPEVLP